MMDTEDVVSFLIFGKIVKKSDSHLDKTNSYLFYSRTICL